MATICVYVKMSGMLCAMVSLSNAGVNWLLSGVDPNCVFSKGDIIFTRTCTYSHSDENEHNERNRKAPLEGYPLIVKWTLEDHRKSINFHFHNTFRQIRFKNNTKQEGRKSQTQVVRRRSSKLQALVRQRWGNTFFFVSVLLALSVLLA